MNEILNDYYNGKLSNAYAIIGSKGSVYKTVIDFCMVFFCDTGNACGVCSSCKKISHEDYLDFHIIRKNAKCSITVDDADYIVFQAIQKSYEGKYKVFFVEESDYMNEAAQNKLLKIIEEPPDNTLFIFGINKISNLLQTIISRCSIVHADKQNPDSLIKTLSANTEISIFDSSVLVMSSFCDYDIAMQLYCDNYLSIRDDILSIIIKIIFAKNYAFSTIIAKIEQYSKKHDLVFLAFNLVLFDLLSLKIKHCIIYNSDKYDCFNDICSKLSVSILVRLLRVVDNYHLRIQQSPGINFHLLYESMVLSMLSITVNNNIGR